jgi:NIMA-interacting peptidyl-prolyl cis-trans isomerase 1
VNVDSIISAVSAAEAHTSPRPAVPAASVDADGNKRKAAASSATHPAPEAARRDAVVKKQKSSSSSSSSSRPPKKVRVFHILKKHKDSSRPSSWREKVITKDKQTAHSELAALRDMILEVSENGQNLQEMRATFEAVATDESDCSSAKRGGDLGFFEDGKMKKEFWKASIALEIGQLGRELIETSSGVHLLMRIG